MCARCLLLRVKVNATEEEVEEWQERFCEDEDDEEQEGGGVRGGRVCPPRAMCTATRILLPSVTSLSRSYYKTDTH